MALTENVLGLSDDTGEGCGSVLDCLCVGAKGPVTLSHLMLPPGHHKILSYLDSCRQLKLVKYTPPPKRSAQMPKKYVPWPESHARFYEAKGNGHAWVSSSSIRSVALQERFPTLRAAHTREFEILKYDFEVHYPAPESRLIQIQASADRSQTVGEDTCYTIARGMRCYDTARLRLVLGIKAMQMQGLHYGPQHSKLFNFVESRLMRLAGNAFVVLGRGFALRARPPLAGSRGRG